MTEVVQPIFTTNDHAAASPLHLLMDSTLLCLCIFNCFRPQTTCKQHQRLSAVGMVRGGSRLNTVQHC